MRKFILLIVFICCNLSSCRGEKFSFSLKGVGQVLNFRKIVDGFNDSVIEGLSYKDVKSSSKEPVYRSRNDVILSLSSLGKDNDNLWSKELKGILEEFKQDADKNGLIIHQKSLDGFFSMRLVDEFSKPAAEKVTALCVRTNFKYWDKSSIAIDKIHRIEVLRSKYESLKKSNSTYVIKKIIYHELMHCLLQLGHLPDTSEYKGHIMHPMYSKSKISKEDWEDMLKLNFSVENIEQMTYMD